MHHLGNTFGSPSLSRGPQSSSKLGYCDIKLAIRLSCCGDRRRYNICLSLVNSHCQSVWISYCGLWGEFWPIITVVTTATMHIQLHLYIDNSRGNNKTIIVSFVTIMYMLLLNWLVLLQSYCNNISRVYLLRYLTNHLFHICSCFHLESPSMVQFWSNSDRGAGVLMRMTLLQRSRSWSLQMFSRIHEAVWHMV